MTLTNLPPARQPGVTAIFVPVWDEAGVIGAMLHHCLTSWKDDAFRIFVGCYTNDPATISAVMAVAERDSRISIVIGPEPGPTTKGDCLNAIWKAMQQKEEAQGWLFKAVVLHDAEDIVHRGEIRLFDHMIERFELVQIPVRSEEHTSELQSLMRLSND